MFENINKVLLLITVFLGSIPTMHTHACDMQGSKTDVTKSQVKMPCHNDNTTEVQSEKQQLSCECLDCNCPDVCSLSLSYGLDTTNSLQNFNFSQHMIRLNVDSAIPIKPPTPLLRPPIIS